MVNITPGAEEKVEAGDAHAQLSEIWTGYCIFRCGHCKHVRRLQWALKNELSLWLVGSPREPRGAPHNAPAAVWLLLGRALLALREPDRQIPFMP